MNGNMFKFSLLVAIGAILIVSLTLGMRRRRWGTPGVDHTGDSGWEINGARNSKSHAG